MEEKEIIIGHGIICKTSLHTQNGKHYFEYEIFDEGKSRYIDCKKVKKVGE